MAQPLPDLDRLLQGRGYTQTADHVEDLEPVALFRHRQCRPVRAGPEGNPLCQFGFVQWQFGGAEGDVKYLI